MIRSPHARAHRDHRHDRHGGPIAGAGIAPGAGVCILLCAVSSLALGDTGGAWETHANLQLARQETGAARIGDFVYVAGGLVEPGLTATGSVERYDIALDEWAFVASLPDGLDHMGAAALDGRLYVVGGYSADFAPRVTVHVYDPLTNLWSLGPPLPEARGAAWMVAHAGRLYHFGGEGPGGTTASTFIFDPIEGWSEGTPMSVPREHLNAVSLGPYIYVIGGRDGAASNLNERYDPAGDEWLPRAPMPTARSAAAVAAFDGKIYVAGGEIPQLFDVNEVYDPATNAWACREPMPVPRHGVAAVTLDDRIFVPAGGTVQGLEPSDVADAFLPGRLVPVNDPAPEIAPLPATARAFASPNPFRGTTTVRVALPHAARVRVEIFDARGRRIHATAERMLTAGVHAFPWGEDRAHGAPVPGVYAYRVHVVDREPAPAADRVRTLTGRIVAVD